MVMNSYWRKGFAWSNSRHNQWKDCKKQYYFNYIKKWDGLPDDPGRENLWRLSKLQKMPFLKGRLIHDTIKQQISNHNAGRGLDVETAKRLFSSQLDASVKNMQNVITEAANGFPPDETEINAIRDAGIGQIENFCNIIWHNYKGVKYLGHEINEKFAFDDTPVRIKYDLFTEKNGVYVITDWKTGSPGFDNANESLQVGTYILWVHQEKGIPLEKIRAELVYLGPCDTETVEKDINDLQTLTNFIKKDSEDMLAVKSEDDFPAVPHQKKCIGCNFLTLCEEGKRDVGG